MNVPPYFISQSVAVKVLTYSGSVKTSLTFITVILKFLKYGIKKVNGSINTDTTFTEDVETLENSDIGTNRS